MNLRESIKHKMKMLCIFSFGRKCGVFFWIALFSSSFLHSQIYIKNGTAFTVNENTIVYSRTDSSALPSQRQKKAVIYTSGETLISGLQENTNAEVLHIAEKQPIKNKKPKIIENVLAEKEQKSVKKQIIPRKQNKFNYNLLNSDEYLDSLLVQKMIAAAIGSNSQQKHNTNVFHSKNTTNFYFFSHYLSEQNYDNRQEVFISNLLNSFKTRPPPSFFSILNFS